MQFEYLIQHYRTDTVPYRYRYTVPYNRLVAYAKRYGERGMVTRVRTLLVKILVLLPH